MAPSGEVGPPWEVTCPHLGSGQEPCPSLGSDLPTRGKWSICLFHDSSHFLGVGIHFLAVGIHFPGVGSHFPDVGIHSQVWTVTSQVWASLSRCAQSHPMWAHFPYRFIPSISQGGSKCPSWCSCVFIPLLINCYKTFFKSPSLSLLGVGQYTRTLFVLLSDNPLTCIETLMCNNF